MEGKRKTCRGKLHSTPECTELHQYKAERHVFSVRRFEVSIYQKQLRSQKFPLAPSRSRFRGYQIKRKMRIDKICVKSKFFAVLQRRSKSMFS